MDAVAGEEDAQEEPAPPQHHHHHPRRRNHCSRLVDEPRRQRSTTHLTPTTTITSSKQQVMWWWYLSWWITITAGWVLELDASIERWYCACLPAASVRTTDQSINRHAHVMSGRQASDSRIILMGIARFWKKKKKEKKRWNFSCQERKISNPLNS